MSYDLTIRSDAMYSQSVDSSVVVTFLRTLPNVEAGDEGEFVLDGRPTAYMTITLEHVRLNSQGELEPCPTSNHQVNSICLYIPYAFLGGESFSYYLGIANSIAHHLGWSVYDEQTGENAPREHQVQVKDTSRKPWWRFW